jgi:hypothetical protein
MSNFTAVTIAYLAVCLFAFIGISGASKLALRAGANEVSALCYGMLYLGASALAIFFAYLPGIAPGLAATTAGAMLSIKMFRATRHEAGADTRPFLIAALFGLCYLAMEHLYAPSDMQDVASKIFFEQVRPPDDRLPFQFARAIFKNFPSRTGIDAFNWYYSDRPPLQTGFTLAFAPLAAIIPEESVYRALSTILQVSVLVAVALFCRTIQLTRRETDCCLIALGTSGFMYYNSVYGWPKLLAAALCIIGMIPLARAMIGRSQITWSDGILVGAALALAVLSHGAVGFTLVTMAICLPALAWMGTFSLRGIAAGATVFAVLLLPWALYTTFIDPNDGKLIKMHLTAGPWDGKQAASQVLKNSYSNITAQTWLNYRIENLKTLFGNNELDRTMLKLSRGIAGGATPPIAGQPAAIDTTQLKYDAASLALLLRVDQREHIVRALGLWALLFPVLALASLTRWRKRIGWPIYAVAMFVLSNAAVWICLEFSPGFTVVTHASFAMIALAFVVAVGAAYRLNHRLCYGILALSVTISGLVWVVIMPGTVVAPISSLHIPPLLITALAAFLLWQVFSDRIGPVATFAAERSTPSAG